jgi:hypothetical protein
MNKILDLLAEQTGGKCYTSYQYCFDATENPSIKYEEIQDYKLELSRTFQAEPSKLKAILFLNISLTVQEEFIKLTTLKLIRKFSQSLADKSELPVAKGKTLQHSDEHI